jgi:uncharacterized protein
VLAALAVACAAAPVAAQSTRSATVGPAQPAPSVGRVTPPAMMTFTSPEAAYEHGRSALQGGHPEMAIKAFEFAAEHDIFLAQFFLARIYADNTVSYTNHIRAFELYQQIVTEHADVDVDDDQRARYVAKALVALAGYYQTGLPNAGVAQDLEQAATLLRNAAESFRDEDGQYEYAKILLKGEGVAANPRAAVYWLRSLSTRGHTSAQAFLADLYWRGTHVERDPTQALLLITLAAENAPTAERIWIEDKYQNIFCGAGEGVRKQAQGAVADWRTKYGRSVAERAPRDGLGSIQPRALRTCSNGETVAPGRRGETVIEPAAKPRADGNSGYVAAPMPGAGSASGFAPSGGTGMRDAGQISPAPVR